MLMIMLIAIQTHPILIHIQTGVTTITGLITGLTTLTLGNGWKSLFNPDYPVVFSIASGGNPYKVGGIDL